MEMDGRNVQSDIEDRYLIHDIEEMDGRNVQSDIEDRSLRYGIEQMAYMLQEVAIISEDRCIYRVPKHLRDTNEAAYVPRLVSLGPFHHGNQNFTAMEEHKLMCFKLFIDKHHIGLPALLKFMKGHEEKTRKYYADPIPLWSNDFVRVILVDAIFVINFLFQFHSYSSAVYVGRSHHEDVFGCKVFRDMMLLENQLPLFILEEILNFVRGTEGTSISKRSVIELYICLFNSHMEKRDSVTELSYFLCNFYRIHEGSITKLSNCLFCYMKEGTDHERDNKDLNSYNNARHFFDFQRLFYMPVEARQVASRNGKFERINSISKLHKAGVRFKLASTKKLFDIKFRGGVLEIPLIEVSDRTQTIFRNLLAYDQCHHSSSHLSDYLKLMGMHC